MRLKKLTVSGFKSFADRTEFAFEGGFTCVVGPNGCGKSNVLDAIKWTLGEQRPTSLRGREMTDVIFNGTDRRPPMGMAEASLHFDNRDRLLPAEHDDVVITRRLFRSGEGEYLINKKAVRLKDVRDLFLGTGLVPGGYAFMEQGKIDSILAGNPVERRRVFEEAAGISRFRARKHETELKLAKVVDNLARLHDIIEEVQRQVRSLKQQAGKARSWRELSTRLKELQVRFNLHKYAEVSAEVSWVAERVLVISRERDGLVLDRDRCRAAAGEVEARLSALSTSVADARERVAELASALEASRGKIVFHSRHQTELRARIEKRKVEIETRSGELGKLEQDVVVAGRECADLTRDRERIAEDLAARTGEYQAAARLREDGSRDVDAAAATLRERERGLSHIATDEARQKSQLAHLDEDLARTAETRSRIESERAVLRAQIDEKSGLRGRQSQSVDDRRQSLAAKELEAESCEQVAADRGEALRKLEAEATRVQSRAEVLDSALHKREGLEEGARAVLQHKDREPGFLPGLRGLLLDLFDVDLDEARAVEAALGDAASALVVETVAEALEGIRFLRESQGGGAMFLPLERFRAAPRLGLNGIRPKTDDVAAVLSALIGGIEVVSGADLTSRLAADARKTPVLVTHEGAVVRNGSVFSLPRGRGKPGLVVHQAELKKLRRDAESLVTKIETARASLVEARLATDSARSSVKDISVALVRDQGDAARLDQELMRLSRDLERIADEDRRELERRARDLAARDESRRRLDELELARQQAADAIASAEMERAGCVERLVAHEVVLRKLADALEQARIEEARTVERLQARVARERHLREAIEGVKAAITSAGREIESDSVLCDESAHTVADEEARVIVLDRDLATSRSLLADRESGAATVQGELSTLAAAAKDVEERLDSVNDALGRERSREAELRANVQGLLDRSREELDIDLRTVSATSADGTTIDFDALASEMKELRDRILRLGNVNLAAIDELQAAEDRATFLEREDSDLKKSQESLSEVLKSIEKQSTALFVETFNAVREHFSVIFRKLFQGGKAEILLEDENNPLESGIEIRARPPGKELRSISLLSGGERTMTAVALLFSILRANPTPCAMLDEVDAALDEDNTERFGRMLDEFLDQSQFVVISHSKRTMDKADVLVGVTMPERGVSRRVAVRLEQISQDGTIRNIDALNEVARKTEQSSPETPATDIAPLAAAEA